MKMAFVKKSVVLRVMLCTVFAFQLMSITAPAYAAGSETAAVEPGWFPAFPGAEGHGAMSRGGRGAPGETETQILLVTNLNDSGPGSFRAACQAEGPRIVVFRVAGEIKLQSVIKIRNPYITIAGQTAPQGGITIRTEFEFDNPLIALTDQVHDVTLRYLKLRLGRMGGAEEEDNLTIRDASNVILDHISAEWSTDENISVTPSSSGWNVSDITIQRSIIGECLESHSTATLITRYGENDQKVERVSVHHNLFAHSGHRNPRVAAKDENVFTGPDVQIINNVVYNWQHRVGTTRGSVMVDLIGNYLKAGPMSNTGLKYVYRHERYSPYDSTLEYPAPSFFIEGNIQEPSFLDAAEDNWLLLTYHNQNVGDRLPNTWRRQTPLLSTIPITVQTAEQAYTSVLADIGANGRLDEFGNWVQEIDSVDSDVIVHVTNGWFDATDGSGGPVEEEDMDHQDDFGGYPEIFAGVPCPDNDKDGMSDVWESANGFDSDDSTDAIKDADGDGYMNIEEFLNVTDPHVSEWGDIYSIVVGQHIFYNNSCWDRQSDDSAIAPDKQALLPGQAAAFANYTSYSRGINGIMVDIEGSLGAVTANDFTFKVGNNSNPGSWAPAAAPQSVEIRTGAGLNGADRISLIWADNAIQKQWLQITVLANQNTGLGKDHVFYFGNAVGEVGNSVANAVVNMSDVVATRNNPRPFFDPAQMDTVHDFNRDKRVDAVDTLICRNNQTSSGDALNLIDFSPVGKNAIPRSGGSGPKAK